MSDLEHLSQQYWDKRYLDGNTQWDMGFISPPIKLWLDKKNQKKLRILIPGAGKGHEVIYAFKKGYKNIYYMDYSIQAIQNFKSACPEFPENQILTDDYFSFNPKIPFDIIIEQTFFCAQNPDKRTEYVNKTHELLSDKGKLIGLLFNVNFETPGPPFGGNIMEYKALFKERFNLLHFGITNDSIAPRLGSEIWMEMVKK